MSNKSTTPVSFVGKHTFTAEEKDSKLQQMLTAMREKEEIEAELKTAKSNYKSKIDSKDGEIKLMSNLLNSGWENKTYNCNLVKNFEDGKRQFFELGTDLLVGEEPLTAADYQMQMDLEEKAIKENNEAADVTIGGEGSESTIVPVDSIGEYLYEKDKAEYTVEPLSDPLEQTEEPTEAQVVNIDKPLKGKEVNKDKFEIKPAPPEEESEDPFGMREDDGDIDPFSFGDI